MRKLWVLAIKEVRVTFRDAGALVTMLATPIALTLAMAAAFGTGHSAPISNIPVLLLNYDTGSMSHLLLDVFQSDDVGNLVALDIVDDEAAARERVDAGEVAALVIVPTDFSARAFPLGGRIETILGVDPITLSPDTELTPEQESRIAQAFLETHEATPDNPAIIEIYASPDWRIGTAVVKSIVTQALEMMNIQVQGIMQVMMKLAPGMRQAGQEPSTMASGMENSFGGEERTTLSDLPLRLDITSTTGRSFNWLDYSAASMAVLFLMFAVTSGGRTLLIERQNGTLPRLLVSPTPALAILVGKMGGIVLTGVLQALILWGATSLIGAYWGAPFTVIIAIFVLVLSASSIGALISAWAKTPGQAGAIGTAVTLVGAALSGSFFERWNLPIWVQYLSLATPQAWGIEIFARLQSGKGLSHILPWLGGTLLLTCVYYSAALLGFRRQFE